MRRLAAVSVGRSDYGIYRPVLRRLASMPDTHVRVIAGGAHLSPYHGHTIDEICDDGFDVEPVEMLLATDSSEGVAKSVGLGVVSFAQSFGRSGVDLLIVLGDRYEMFSAAAAALPMLVPVAHLHGGEKTTGAFDDALRHAITKLSHLHFVSTEAYRRRVLQLGEEPWRVTVSGAPGLDAFLSEPKLVPETIRERFGLDVESPFVLATFHPVTLDPAGLAGELDAFFHGVASAQMPAVFTMPNADPGASNIRARIADFVAAHPGSVVVESFGARAYPTVLSRAMAMIGNSSSGIIEAPSFGLPVVNIGSRQHGRVRAANVIDVDPTPGAVSEGVARALSPAFRASLANMTNPYGDGSAAERIAEVLTTVPLDLRLIQKQFVDTELDA